MTKKVLIAASVLVFAVTGLVLRLQQEETGRGGIRVGSVDSSSTGTGEGEFHDSSLLHANRVMVDDRAGSAAAKASPVDGSLGEASAAPSTDESTPPLDLDEELQDLGLELLNEVLLVEEKEGLSSVSSVRLEDWAKRAWSVHCQLVLNAFDELRDRGSVEVVVMSEPDSAKLDALYDCAYSWTSGEADGDGVERVEVCVYPWHEYAVLNELAGLKARLDEIRRARNPH